MKTLTDEQTAVVNAKEHKIFVSAGPGTGKTHTLVARIQAIINAGTSPSSIVAVTFTNAAARELESRIGQKLGFTGTIHSLMLRLLREHYPDASVMDDDTAENLLSKIAHSHGYKDSFSSLESVIAQGFTAIANRPTKAQLVAYQFYNTMLENFCFTFDALLVFGLQKLKTWNSDRRITHILWDEVQDSGKFDVLIWESMNIANKFWVGDCNQAIYSFRGNELDKVIQLANSVTHHKLNWTHRYGKAICDAANKLISHNKQRIPSESIPMTPKDCYITKIEHDSTDNELLWLAQTIRDMRGTGPLSCAVLVRTNELVSHFSMGLAAFSIPIVERTINTIPGLSKLVIALSALASPENDMVMFRYITLAFGSDEAHARLAKAKAAFTSINRSCGKWPTNPSLKKAHDAVMKAAAIVCPYAILAIEALSQSNPEMTISDLIFELNSLAPSSQATDTNAITVGTIHGAKGLEFDAVFMPAFEQEVIPAKHEIQEERRLAYVGLTRSKKYAFFSVSAFRATQWSRGLEKRSPSQFLSEMEL